MFFKTFNSYISCLKNFNYAFLLSQAAFVFNHGFCSIQMEQNLMEGVNTTGNFHLLSSSVALLRYCNVLLLYRCWSFMYSCWWFVNIGIIVWKAFSSRGFQIKQYGIHQTLKNLCVKTAEKSPGLAKKNSFLSIWVTNVW